MSTELKEHIDMAFRTAVKEVLVEDGHAVREVLENDEVIKRRRSYWHQDETVAWLTKVLKQHGLELYNNQVDT